MAGIVTYTGAQLIKQARELVSIRIATFLCVLCSIILHIACSVFVITYGPSFIPSLPPSLHYSMAFLFINDPFPCKYKYDFSSVSPFPFTPPFLPFSLLPVFSSSTPLFLYSSLPPLISSSTPLFLHSSLPPLLSSSTCQSLTHINNLSLVLSIRSNKSVGHSNSIRTVFGASYPPLSLKILNSN